MNAQEALNLGLQHHQAGRLREAESIYRQILAANPLHADSIQLLGVLASQTGQRETAVQLIQRAIAINPNVADYYANLGVVFSAMGRTDEAQAQYERAIALRPDYPEAWNNLGNIYRDRGRVDDALAAYDKSLAARPDYPDTLVNVANILRDRGRNQEATALLERALQVAPSNAAALCNYGNYLKDKDRLDDAMAAYQRAIAASPTMAEAHTNLAGVLREKQRIDEALAEYNIAIQLRPDFAEAHYGMAFTFREAGRIDDAIAASRRAIQCRENYTDAHANLATVLHEKGSLDEAIVEYNRALELKPDYAEALSGLSQASRDRGRFEQAIAACEKAIALRPDLPELHNNLGVLLKDQGRIEEAMAAFIRSMEMKPAPLVESNQLYISHFLTDFDPQALLQRHFQWDRQFGHQDPIAPYLNDRSPDRSLRIGLVSSDIRFHSVAFFMYPFLKLHDPRQVRIACYVTSDRHDYVTASLRKCVEGWQSIFGKTDEQAERLIRRDQIDILFDLAGHTSGGRLTLFARKPAPVQVTYLGYPNTTGLKAIDWRLTDEISDPPGSESLYSEKLLRLPHTAWCFYPLSGSPPVQPPPSIANGFITFASFNDLAKVNAPLLRTWAKILNRVENSRLVLKNRGLSATSVRPRFQEMLVECGLDLNRVVFFPRQPKPSDHLLAYHDVDLALDTFPYHGTTTTCEALWMGVPVVTRVGATHVSRVGASLLTTIGLTDLIAADEEQYIEIAVTLARDIGRLTSLRDTLRQRMQNSKLMDAASMARDLEAACRKMWHNWLET